MDNMGEEKIGKKKSLVVRELLINNLGSKFLQLMEDNSKELKLRDKLMGDVKKAVGTCLIHYPPYISNAKCVVMFDHTEGETGNKFSAFIKALPPPPPKEVNSDEDMMGND